ncbi:DsbA family protein [Mucispirillum schaedleri]|uniref:DsbA family protein n=1 Tax=Mucispirillum schaedleri TaxID=248039 RepID=UPI001F5675EB|nr:thioredoxin domain-containing protein [Mucispirillum schaedleri]
MKRLFILVVLLAAFVTGCKSADLKVLEKNLQAGFAQTGQDIKVQVIELKNLKDILPGFAFVEIKIYNNNNLVNTERFITNGRYFAKDIIDSKTLSSLKDELDFEFAKVETIDTSKLTLASGNKDAKNVIVEITDFQCPYCKKANALFKEKLADKSDYALYIVHLPLDMHPNAQIMAQIFEAGMQMGFNFKNELFEADYIKVIESKIEDLQEAGTQLNQETLAVLIDEVNNQIINDFAAKTDNPDKFKSLVLSDEIKTKVDETKELAENLNISATPAFYINGKAISGYNERLILKALDDIK